MRCGRRNQDWRHTERGENVELNERRAFSLNLLGSYPLFPFFPTLLSFGPFPTILLRYPLGIGLRRRLKDLSHRWSCLNLSH